MLKIIRFSFSQVINLNTVCMSWIRTKYDNEMSWEVKRKMIANNKDYFTNVKLFKTALTFKINIYLYWPIDTNAADKKLLKKVNSKSRYDLRIFEAEVKEGRVRNGCKM